MNYLYYINTVLNQITAASSTRIHINVTLSACLNVHIVQFVCSKIKQCAFDLLQHKYNLLFDQVKACIKYDIAVSNHYWFLQYVFVSA